MRAGILEYILDLLLIISILFINDLHCIISQGYDRSQTVEQPPLFIIIIFYFVNVII